MPLENFGSILNFAEELETQDQMFYEMVAANPACAAHKQMFEQFAADAKKNIKTAQRTRRESSAERPASADLHGRSVLSTWRRSRDRH